MKKNLKFTLILVIIICATIEGSHLFHRRLEGEIISLTFTKAYNLIFGDDSKWKFDINYAKDNTPLTTGSTYTVSILNKGQPAYASCTVSSTSLLNCVLNDLNQEKSDLIQINNNKNNANIEWIGLTEVKNIIIKATLNYEDSYSLTYDTSNFIWEFKVKIMDEDILPENGLVTIDLIYITSDNTLSALADCTHNSHYLNCNFNLQRPQQILLKVSKTQNTGSIFWKNLQNDNTKELTIPIKAEMSLYTKKLSKELELINGQWNYRIQARTNEKIFSDNTLITINSKIVKKGNAQPLYYLTRCYAVENDQNNNDYKCKVIGENQEITDLVYVSNSPLNEISINWGTVLTSDDPISRKAELSFVKAHDLIYSNEDWKFKIDVKDDENMPENAIVWVTVKAFTTTSVQWYYKICTFNEHVLSCADGSDSSSSGDTLERIQTQKQRQSIGSVTWKNVKLLHIDIPLNYTFSTFKNAYGGFFTDKWHFMINANYKDSCPVNATVIIDILQNDVETTASCILLQKNAGSNGKLHCISDYPDQENTDSIKISSAKKYGSVHGKEVLLVIIMK